MSASRHPEAPAGPTIAEQLARALFDQSPFSTVIYDADGHPLALNAAFTTLWAARLEDVPPDYTVLTDPQLESQGVIPAIRRAFEGEVVTTPPVRYSMAEVSIRGSGRTVWTQGHFHPLRDASGRVTHVVLTHVDITERMLVEQELRHAVARVEALQRATGELTAALTPREVADVVIRNGLPALGAMRGSVAMLDAEGRQLEIVGAAGYPAGTLARFRRVPIDEPFPLTDAVRSGAAILLPGAEARAARYPNLAELRTDNGSGAMAAIPLRATSGVVGALGLNWSEPRDFTPDDVAFIEALAQQCGQALDRARLYENERLARAEARAAADRLQTIADASHALTEQSLEPRDVVRALADILTRRVGDQCVVRLVSEDGEWLDAAAVRHVNPETQALLQSLFDTDRYHVGDGLAGEVFRTGEPVFIPVADPASLAVRLKRAYRPWADRVGMRSVVCVPLRARDATLGTIFMARGDGARPYTRDDLALVGDVATRAALAIERARLYAAERHARAAAEDANRAKGDFLAAMSHELRTPLNGIGGYVGLLEMELRGPITEQQREDLGRIRRNQQHLLTLIEDVLSFARVEAGRLEVRETRVPLGEMLQRLAPMVLPQLQAKRMRYVEEACNDSLAALGDGDRIIQICVNLLTNAIKATPDGGTITIACEGTGDRVRIRVSDTGHGIPAEKREAIFTPFTQLGRSLNNPRGGAGLGLSISRGLAEAMGGELTVESEEGRGSTFTLTLRRAS